MIGRPPGKTGRTQLKQEDLIRIQVLYRDAKMGPTEIHRVTGYTIHQIKYALKKKTTEVGRRPGRPRKGESPQKNGTSGEAQARQEETEALGREVDMEDDFVEENGQQHIELEQPAAPPAAQPVAQPPIQRSEPEERLAELQAAIDRDFERTSTEQLST